MPHHWQIIAVGRICIRCNITQVKGEFEDDSPCPSAPDDGQEPETPSEK